MIDALVCTAGFTLGFFIGLVIGGGTVFALTWFVAWRRYRETHQ